MSVPVAIAAVASVAANETSSIAGVVVIAQTAIAGAVVAPVKPSSIDWPPIPPAAESYAKCVELGLLAQNPDGTYRALKTGANAPGQGNYRDL